MRLRRVKPFIADPAAQARIWKLRTLALGLSMAEKGDAKAISFVEDTAVALEISVTAIHEIPERELFTGHTSGSARPLVWAHAEYLKLRRSIQQGGVFDQPPQTVARYLTGTPRPVPSHQTGSVPDWTVSAAASRGGATWVW